MKCCGLALSLQQRFFYQMNWQRRPTMTETTIAAMTSTGKDDWETPHWLFDKLNAEFHFTLDPCCTHQTAKCRKHYTPAENGLIQDWGGRLFFAILPTPARPAQTPAKSHGCRNAQQRRKSPTQLLWRCCPRERTQSFFIPISTAKQRSVFSRAVCHFLTTAKKPASPCLAR